MTGPVALPEPVSPERSMPHAIGLGTVVALVVAGLVFGVMGAFLQAVTVTVGRVVVPIGLVVMLAALLAFIRALIHSFDRRLAGVWFFAGWAVASLLLALPWPGGDIVIGDGVTAKIYLFGGAILASAAANLPARIQPPDGDADAGHEGRDLP